MSMRRLSACVCLLGGFALSGSLYASSIGAAQAPVRAMFAHEKAVRFSVRNETAAVLKLQCGDQVLSVAPGKTELLKVPVGGKVTFAEASGAHAAGELLAEAGSEMNGTTVVVH